MGGHSFAHYPLAQAPQASMLHQSQLPAAVYSGKQGAPPTHHSHHTPWIWRSSPNEEVPQPSGAAPPQVVTHLGVGEPNNPKEAQRVVKCEDGFVGLVVNPQDELS